MRAYLDMFDEIYHTIENKHINASHSEEKGKTKSIAHILNIELHRRNFKRALEDAPDMHDIMMGRNIHHIKFNGLYVPINYARSFFLGMSSSYGYEAYVPGHPMRQDPNLDINPNYMVFLKSWNRYSEKQQNLWQDICGVTRKESDAPKCTFKSLYDLFELIPFFIENYNLTPPTFRLHDIGFDEKLISHLEKKSFEIWGYKDAFLREAYMEGLEFMLSSPLEIENSVDSTGRKHFNEEEILGVYDPLNGYPFDQDAEEQLRFGAGYHFVFIDKNKELLLKHKKISPEYYEIAKQRYDALFKQYGASYIREHFCNFEVDREHFVSIDQQKDYGFTRETSNRPGLVLPMTRKNHIHTDFNGKKWGCHSVMEKLTVMRDRKWSTGSFRKGYPLILCKALEEIEDLNDKPGVLSKMVSDFVM